MSRIEDYGLIGDLHTGALVGRDGSIDWLCLPNFDSPACFAALLDSSDAGRWLLAPTSSLAAGFGVAPERPAISVDNCTRRQYRQNTLVLETEWQTPTGRVKVTDFMPPRTAAVDIVRIVEGMSGSVEMHSELVLRFDYGRIVPWVRKRQGGIEAIAGPDAVWLRTPVELRGAEQRSLATFTVHAGERVPFVLTWAPSHRGAPGRVDAEELLLHTSELWQAWSARGRVKGPWSKAIKRSLLTLKALTFQPTGGIVAALTTSLPEQIGGPRNWDYRYCWLRDATYTLQALLAAEYVDEAKAWRDWLLRAVAGDPSQLQIMYGLDGTRRLTEYEVPWLSGYEGSSPVRIGNAAADQLQLDVWGEVLDGLSLARGAGISHRDDAWDLQVALLDHLEGAWHEPDNGLWEMRGARRHFVHSKVMAWVAFDRMVRGVRDFGMHGDVDRWEATRDQIYAEVLEKGFNEDKNSFVQSYDTDQLDASLLILPRVGFVSGDDPRMLGTIDAIQREITQDGFVMRYRPTTSDDGLPGGEGVFVACSFWLVDALHAAGREQEAVELYERLLDLRNDLGLLSEEWDPVAKRQLGNTPQAFSHFPLVVSGLQLQSRRPRRSYQMIGGG
jgi:GH15 family glucan-1,4-alpha-glucosidase